MKRELLFFVIISWLIHASFSQFPNTSSRKGEISYGIGLGLPYGGIGVRLGYNVVDNLNLFGGIGSQRAGVGYNLGLMKDFKPIGVVQPYLSGMFGSNSAIKLIGVSYDRKVYFGPSAGVGVKINSRSWPGNYWQIGAIYALKPASYKNEIEFIKSSSLANRLNEQGPILFVFGYVFHY